MSLELDKTPAPTSLDVRLATTEKRLDGLEASVAALKTSTDATRAEMGSLSAEIRRASALPAAGLANLLAGAATGSSVTSATPVLSSLAVAALYLVVPRLIAMLRGDGQQPP